MSRQAVIPSMVYVVYLPTNFAVPSFDDVEVGGNQIFSHDQTAAKSKGCTISFISKYTVAANAFSAICSAVWAGATVVMQSSRTATATKYCIGRNNCQQNGLFLSFNGIHSSIFGRFCALQGIVTKTAGTGVPAILVSNRLQIFWVACV